MSLVYVGAPAKPSIPPERILAFIRASQNRVERFRREAGDIRFPGFVSSDPFQVYALLRRAMDACGTPRPRFVEWGSGLGIATCLAALLGCRATGIEIEPSLAREARAIAEDFGIEADFLHASFVPEGWLLYEGMGGPDVAPVEHNRLSRPTAASYPGLDAELAEIDLVFAYPWPDEQPMILKLFENIAATDAVIAVYFGSGDHAVYRQTPEPRAEAPH